MNNPTDSRMISGAPFRQKMAEAIVSGIVLFRGAVSGVTQFQQPSAMASATDSTNVPNLAQGTVGADTDASSAIQAAAQALAN